MSKLGVIGVSVLFYGIWCLASYLNHDLWFQYLIGLIPASLSTTLGFYLSRKEEKTNE